MCGADLSDLDECDTENRKSKRKEDGIEKKDEREIMSKSQTERGQLIAMRIEYDFEAYFTYTVRFKYLKSDVI